MSTPTYLVAKFVPDIVRMEPKNVGVILWASGGIAYRFLPPESTSFIPDEKVFARWISRWVGLCNQPQLKMRDGKEVSRRSLDFLKALRENQKGNYLLYEGGYIAAEVKAASRDEAVDSLFRKLVSEDKESEAASSASEGFLSRCNSILEDAGLKELPGVRLSTNKSLEVEAQGGQQKFNFDYVLGDEFDCNIGALLQRIKLKHQPSTTNAAFLFEHANSTPKLKTAKRVGLIDSSEISTDPSATDRRTMLEKVCKIVDIADRRNAIKDLSTLCL